MSPEAQASALAASRSAIRRLLDEESPADAMAAYYAFHHPDAKTRLITYPSGAAAATGYLALSRTGLDLFRPVMTLRLPAGDPEGGAALILGALAAHTGVISFSQVGDAPLLGAMLHVVRESLLRIYVLEPGRIEPEINVLVRRLDTAGSLPYFAIESGAGQGGASEIVASASINWQSPRFAEIALSTRPQYRRRGWGRSVASAMVQHLRAGGRQPLYVVADNNEASIRLAEGLGFTDCGAREVMIEGTLRRHP